MTGPLKHSVMQKKSTGANAYGVCDLIAAEAKYHLPCLSVFKRNAEEAELETKESDLAMIWLCDKLEYAADKGSVIKLNDTWNRDMVLAERAEIEIPRSFISLKSTLKDKLRDLTPMT